MLEIFPLQHPLISNLLDKKPRTSIPYCSKYPVQYWWRVKNINIVNKRGRLKNNSEIGRKQISEDISEFDKMTQLKRVRASNLL